MCEWRWERVFSRIGNSGGKIVGRILVQRSWRRRKREIEGGVGGGAGGEWVAGVLRRVGY